MKYCEHGTGRIRPVVAKRNEKQDTNEAQERSRNGLITKLRSGDRPTESVPTILYAAFASRIGVALALSLEAKCIEAPFDERGGRPLDRVPSVAPGLHLRVVSGLDQGYLDQHFVLPMLVVLWITGISNTSIIQGRTYIVIAGHFVPKLGRYDCSALKIDTEIKGVGPTRRGLPD